MTYFFVIHTDQYARNFERQLCAYLTGQVGECKVGSEMAEIARQEVPYEWIKWCETHIINRPDEHGVHRPVKTYPAPNLEYKYDSIEPYFKYNSIAIYFNEIPSSKQVSFLKERAYKFSEFYTDEKGKDPINISGFEVLEEIIKIVVYTKFGIGCTREMLKLKIE
jgi:hypothetical protein